MQERLDHAEIPASWRPEFRSDVGRLRKAERTPSGGARVPAAVSREGILEYQRADGSIQRELVPLEELQRPEAMRSLRDAVVTVGHPDGGARMVTPATYRSDSVGHVSGEPRVEQGHLMADVAVLEADALRRIDTGELVELSAGYRVLIDPTPGEWQGQRYDAVQRRREYNHVALLPAGGGRAGASVALRIDGRDVGYAVQVRREDHWPAAPVLDSRSDSMTTPTIERETIDGIPLIIGSPEWRQALARDRARRDAEIEKLEGEKKKLDVDKAAVEAELALAKAKVAELEKMLAEMGDPERADARLAARLELVEHARRVLGPDEQGKPRAFKRADGKSQTDKEIKLAVLGKVATDLGDLTKLTDVQLDAHFDARVRTQQAASTPSDPLTRSRGDAFGAPTAPTLPPVPRIDGGGGLSVVDVMRQMEAQQPR